MAGFTLKTAASLFQFPGIPGTSESGQRLKPLRPGLSGKLLD